MKNRTVRGSLVILLILAAGGALACAKKPEAPAVEETSVLETAPPGEAGDTAGLTASAFVLNMRVLEGVREKAPAPPKTVTSSYLKFMNFANYELEEDIKADQQIQKVYSLKDVRLIATVDLAWEKGKAEKALYMFRLNGQEYLAIVTPGRLPERNHFRIEVYEQSGDQANLWIRSFLCRTGIRSVGFDTLLKPYFITLKVVRWSGEPAGAPGGTVGGVVGEVVGGVLKSGAGDKVKPPKLIKEVPPVYPDIAAQARVEGVVIIEATTDTYGRVAEVKVLRSVPLLDQAAVDAVRQWVYDPVQQGPAGRLHRDRTLRPG
jgi:TonB family protein